MTWYNPILLEPRFQVATRHEPIRIPLAPSAPPTLVERLRFPAFLGEGLAVYVSEEPPPSLVFCAGPDDWGYPGQDSAALYLARLFAPHLPDFHLLLHYEEQVRGTLSRVVVTELVVRASVPRQRVGPTGLEGAGRRSLTAHP